MLGLDCLEIEFVKGVYLNEAQAKAIAGIAKNNSVRISVHAPYYLNFNAHEPAKLHASQGILLKAARIAALCSAKNVVFHPGFYLGDSPEKAGAMVLETLAVVSQKLQEESIDITLRPESSGKPSQFGDLDELFALSLSLTNVAPCIDFAHLHARSGKNNSYDEFRGLLNSLRKNLGEDALSNMHIHVSGIEYSKSGERKHLPLRSSDFKYEDLLRALKDYNISGSVICESPNREEDALLLKESYQKI